MPGLQGFFENKSILITGGTGSFGKHFIHHILTQYNPARVIVYSRNEYSQYQVRQIFLHFKNKLRFFVGDVRDEERLIEAMNRVDYVIHAAALKHVDVVEYNPIEAVLTNILGSANVLRAAIEAGVKKVVFLSTDKACQPINLYGATKLVAEKLILNANYYKPIFNCVRYGNVMGARGSVIELFEKLSQENKRLTITHPHMTRFWMSYKQAIDLVLLALQGTPGLTYIGKVPSFRITDLAGAYKNVGFEVVGLRPGEKLHEILIHEYEVPRAYDMGNYFVIVPDHTYQDALTYKSEMQKGCLVTKPYSSDENEFLTIPQIKERIDEEANKC